MMDWMWALVAVLVADVALFALLALVAAGTRRLRMKMGDE